MTLLSTKPIPVRERLIFALDVSTRQEAEHWVEALGDSVLFYKLGLQIFMAGGYYELIDWLASKGKKVFVDLKSFLFLDGSTLDYKEEGLMQRGFTFLNPKSSGTCGCGESFAV